MENYRNISRTPTASRLAGLLFGDGLLTAARVGRAATMLLLGGLALSACATQEIDEPVAQITRADTAIQNAVQAGAREAAPMELQSAQDHYRQAQQATVDEQYSQASQLAEKAEADAQLAQAKARTMEAYQTVAELEEGIRTLQEEIERDIERDSNF